MEQIKVYAPIGIAAMTFRTDKRRSEIGAFSFWTIARHLNTSGSGWVSVRQIKEYCKEIGWTEDIIKKSSIQAMETGYLIYGQNAVDEEVFYIPSPSKIAKKYGLQDAGKYQILLSTRRFKKAGVLKASLWSAWHACRDRGPIARDTMKEITSVPTRTQRYYENKTHVARKTNYVAYGNGNIPQEMGALVRDNKERGGYFMVHGQLWEQLPNSYKSPLERSSACRKVNRKLRVLSLGLDGERQRVYCQNIRQTESSLKARRYDRPGIPTAFQSDRRLFRNTHRVTSSGAGIYVSIST